MSAKTNAATCPKCASVNVYRWDDQAPGCPAAERSTLPGFYSCRACGCPFEVDHLPGLAAGLPNRRDK